MSRPIVDEGRRQFIKTSAIAVSSVGAAAPLSIERSLGHELHKNSYGVKAKTWWRKASFKNWTGNVTSEPKEVLSPTSQSELQTAISNANRIRAVGSGHSFSPVAATNDTMIYLGELNAILELDPDKMTVKAQAGISIHDLNNQLNQLGFTLPSIGDIDVQSIAGAVSTGTHGTGMAWGSFSDEGSIAGMDIILADGTLLQLDSENPQDREFLQAARLSLGLLGVVYAITFRIVPAHNLEMHSRLLSLEEALDPALYINGDHFEFFRFPFTELVQAKTRNITTKEKDTSQLSTWFNEVFLENYVLGTILNVGSIAPTQMPEIMKFLTTLVPDEKYVDRSDRVMATVRMVRAFEVEHAIALDKTQEAQELFNEIVLDFSNRPKGQGRFFANFPCECRFIKADAGNLLSPTLGQDSCYFSVTSHTSFDGYEPFFREVEAMLLSLGGKPHWGKQFYQNPLERHQKLDQFLAVKNQLDPGKKFENDFTSKLLSGESF